MGAAGGPPAATPTGRRSVSRGSILARIRRLEQPRRKRTTLRQELEELERLYPPMTREQIEALTDEQLDHFLDLHMAKRDGGPIARMLELRELLRSPEEVAEDERRRAQFEAMTLEELENWFAEHCRTAS